MQLTITINTDNDSFKPAPQLEVARILADLSEKAEEAVSLRDMNGRKVMDENGNSVGKISVK